jgi:hypothetical protein
MHSLLDLFFALLFFASATDLAIEGTNVLSGGAAGREVAAREWPEPHEPGGPAQRAVGSSWGGAPVEAGHGQGRGRPPHRQGRQAPASSQMSQQTCACSDCLQRVWVLLYDARQGTKVETPLEGPLCDCLLCFLEAGLALTQLVDLLLSRVLTAP